MVGEESVGGSVATPDQDRVDEIGAAAGLTYQDDEPLNYAGKMRRRDEERWELNPASAADAEPDSEGRVERWGDLKDEPTLTIEDEADIEKELDDTIERGDEAQT